MNERIDEQLQHRIVRYLDGELDQGQEATLLRELMRNPSARDLMDRYAQIDKASAEALSALVESSRPSDIGAITDVSPMPIRRWRPNAPLRIAAAVALLVLGAYGTTWLMLGQESATDEAVEDAVVLDVVEQALPIDDHLAGQQQIDHDFIAYFDQENDRFYLVEVDRELTAIQTVSAEL